MSGLDAGPESSHAWQRERWAASQLGDEAAAAHHESVALTLEGPLDEFAVRSAPAALVARHAELCAGFSADGAQPCVRP